MNFSHCDIRGIDFADAVLINANFSYAKAGQPLQWVVIITAFMFLCASISGYVTAYAAGVIGSLMVMQDNQPIALYSSVVALFVLAVLLLITVRNGLSNALGTFSIIIAFSIVFLAGLGKANATVAAIVQTVAIAGAISGSIVSAISFTTLNTLIFRISLFSFTTFFSVGSFFGGWEGLERGSEHLTQGLPITILLTGILYVFGVYIGLRVTHQDYRYWLIYKAANFLSALGGTRFWRANLTDADFTNASLKSADFREAILTRTCWLNACNLKYARLEDTYLNDPQICQLVVAEESQNKNFEYRDLRGLNLKGRNLKNTCFSGSNLSEATLENADLTGVSLASAQLYRANLNGACLTGAYIENWGISTDTELNLIQCDYIYMHLPTEQDPDPCRKPDNRKEIFKPDDFTDFIIPIIKTLDLYQTQNLDPRKIAPQFKTLDLFLYDRIDPNSVAIAFQELSDQYPDAELNLLTVEGKGQEKLRLQTKVQQGINRSELYAHFFARYHEILSLPNQDKQDLIENIVRRDEHTLQILSELSKLVSEAVKQPRFYTEVYQHTGDLIMSQENKGNVSIGDVQGNLSGIAASGESQVMTGVAIGTISGSVMNTINQLPASPDPNNPGIKELLAQLQTAIEAESELPDDDKAEALDQLKTLAEAGQKPEDNALQKAAKTSMKILKGTVASLPDAAKLAESCAKLLPAISTLLALV